MKLRTAKSNHSFYQMKRNLYNTSMQDFEENFPLHHNLSKRSEYYEGRIDLTFLQKRIKELKSRPNPYWQKKYVAIRKENFILKKLLMRNLPHIVLMKNSIMVFFFFFFTFILNTFLNTVIIIPFWNNIGLFVSFAFFVMAIFLRNDYYKLKKNKVALSNLLNRKYSFLIK